MPTRLLTQPVAYPLHLNQVRQHLREDLTENDGLIELYLSSAINEAFAITGRQLVAARYQAVFDYLPCQLELDVAPLIQVVGVQYLDGNNQWQTVAATDYVVESSFKPRITHTLGINWPVPQGQIGAVQVTFDAGYVAYMQAESTANSLFLYNWRPLAVNDVLRFSNSGGALPSPLQKHTNYYVNEVVSADTYKVSAMPGGAVIDIIDNGSGYHYAGQIGLDATSGQAQLGDAPGEIPAGLLAYLLMETETLYSFRGNLINTPGSTINEHPFRKYMLDPYRTSYL